jgi:pyridoxal phosphate enzyme (YggS family)
MSIAENLHRVREHIARAAELAGRRADEITLVGVTKYVGAREAAEIAAAGCPDLGESRPQGLWKKAEEINTLGAVGVSHSTPQIRWHLVGHLQRNKVRRTLPLVSLIHSVDSERLMAELNDACIEGCGILSGIDILLEVNTSGEAAKHGLAPEDVARLLDAASRYPRVIVLGLMTMAALDGGPDVAAKNFAALRDLRDRLKPNKPDTVLLNELSMGMSGDFEVAIKEGATIVRIGSALWENTL